MILKSRCFRLILFLACVTGRPGQALAQDDATSVARRIGAIAAIAADEYALGVADGRVVRAAELDEARLFLTEARRLANRLPDEARGVAVRRVGELLGAADRLAEPEVLSSGVAALHADLAAALGIVLDPMPAAPVALERGQDLYRTRCASCHGARGDGRGPASAGLDPAPADLRDRLALGGTSPLDFFRKISVGVAGTAMAGYEDALSVDDRWAVALYASGLRYQAEAQVAGRRWLSATCPTCMVVVSDGVGLLDVSDDSLAALLTAEAGRTVPPEAIAFARTAGAADVLGSDRTLAVRRAVRRATDLVARASGARLAGDTAAALAQALEAYLAFEAVERQVGARSGRAVGAVERAYGAFRATLAAGDSAATIAAAARLSAAFGLAVDAVGGGSSANVLFGQSVVIILREGLEAMLIIGALMAFVIKAGAPERRRQLATGAGLAVLASLATAALFGLVPQRSLASQEAFEGIVMLLASVVLFGVASWMVSRVEAERWRAFVRARIETALSTGGAAALASVAFLAVYREGVETVLFYAALFGTAKTPQGTVAVWIGLGAGLAVLLLLYAGMQRWGMRIPIRPFFAVTGILLTVMAVSFAGQGVAELQAAGWVPATPLRLPTLPALGIFPTVQTMLVQAGVGVAFVVALLWVFLVTRPVARVR